MTLAQIRPAEPLDAGILGAIMGDAQDALTWMPRIYSRAEDIHHCDQMIHAGWVNVLRYKSDIIGFVAREVNYIHALYLAPTYQRQGFGSVLLKACKATSNHLVLNSYQQNNVANQFYVAADFSEVSRSDGEGDDLGLPDIEFEWHRDGLV